MNIGDDGHAEVGVNRPGLQPRVLCMTEPELQKLKDNADFVKRMDTWSIALSFVLGALFVAGCVGVWRVLYKYMAVVC